MFFLNTRKRLVSNSLLFHLLPSLAVFLTLLSLTMLSWHNATQTVQNERDSLTANFATGTRDSILQRLGNYELVLRGASGLFISSQDVSRQEWSSFVSSFDLQNKYPGVLGVGFLQSARHAQLADIIAVRKLEGFQDFHIFPEGQRDMYAILTYFEPFNDRVAKALGYDMYAEQSRREAMQRAVRTGEASLTSELQFLQIDGNPAQEGFTLFMPVYAQSSQAPPSNKELKGFAYAPLASQGLFHNILGERADKRYALRVRDTATNKLYESPHYARLAEAHDSYDYTLPVEVYGRTWTLDFRFDANIVPTATRTRPLNSLISGVALSLLLAGFVFALLVSRTKALGQAKQLEIQNAKDELLSLASHQLRTPATSVKQYVAMLRDGFAGKLTKNQHRLLDRAYESNERQLHIINQLLYVAKIDAKGIVLTPRKLDVKKLLRSVVHELTPLAKETNQKLRLKLPGKKVTVQADEHCLAMSIENLVSNAIKYSYPDSTITLTLTSQKGTVCIAVKDHGVGIASEDLSMLFQRFSRIPNELSRQTSGSGIGLYLSQQFINLHGGTITVDSEKDVGTTFTIVLPKSQKE